MGGIGAANCNVFYRIFAATSAASARDIQALRLMSFRGQLKTVITPSSIAASHACVLRQLRPPQTPRLAKSQQTDFGLPAHRQAIPLGFCYFTRSISVLVFKGSYSLSDGCLGEFACFFFLLTFPGHNKQEGRCDTHKFINVNVTTLSWT